MSTPTPVTPVTGTITIDGVAVPFTGSIATPPAGPVGPIGPQGLQGIPGMSPSPATIAAALAANPGFISAGAAILAGGTTTQPPTPIVIAPATLPGAVVGTAYNVSFTASGGTGPYTWAITDLPPGLIANLNVISGTPLMAGNISVSVKAMDELFASTSLMLPLAITGTATGGGTSPSGTTIPPAASITDVNGVVWTLTAGAQVAVNGTADATTNHAIELAYVNGKLWQQNSNALWWYKVLPTDQWAPGPGTATSPLTATTGNAPTTAPTVTVTAG